jgi:AcrR family transcriptional regulator
MAGVKHPSGDVGANARRTPIEDIRRSELVQAAIEVIAKRGFDRTTVRDIAKSAGAAAGSVHYYFKSKDELLRAAFEELEARFHRQVEQTLSTDGSASDKLRSLVDLFFGDSAAETEQWDVQIDVWQQASRHAEFREAFTAAHDWWVTTVAEILAAKGAQAEQAEARPPADLRRDATELAALMDGLGIYCHVTHQVDSELARRIALERLTAMGF